MQNTVSKLENMGIHTLNNGVLQVLVNEPTGQVISAIYNNNEYFHGGGKPEELKDELDKLPGTWPNSIIYTFPVIGKHFKDMPNLEKYSLGAHGISRALNWEKTDLFQNEGLKLIQDYDGKKIPNPRFGRSNEPEFLQFLPYSLKQDLFLNSNLILFDQEIKNKSQQNMYYKFGVHPAFRFDPKNIAKCYFLVGFERKKLLLEDMIHQSNGEAFIFNRYIEEIYFVDEIAEKEIELSLKNDADHFDNMMLWTPGKETGVICIEPTTSLKEYKVLEPEEIAIYNFIMKFS
jgi:hypothetical protein